MTRDAFFKAIKNGGLSGAYILHGEEEFIKDSALSQIKALIDPALGDLNMDVFPTASADGIITACETLPFMSDIRLVIVRALPSESDAQKLISYIPSIAPSTLLIFIVKGKADGRLAFVKALKGMDRLIEFDMLNESDAARWIRQQARIRSVFISDSDAAYFVAVAGCDCMKLNNEFKKAAAYVGEGCTVDRSVISKVVTKDLDFIVFSVLDHLLAGRTHDGFTALKNIIADGEDAMQIANVLGDKARLTLQARIMLEKKLSKDAITKALGVSPGYAYRIIESARLLRADKKDALAECSLRLCDVTLMPLSGKGNANELLERALIVLAK